MTDDAKAAHRSAFHDAYAKWGRARPGRPLTDWRSSLADVRRVIQHPSARWFNIDFSALRGFIVTMRL